MGEGDSDGTQGEVGEEVAERVDDREREDGLDPLGGELWGRVEAESPHGEGEEGADDELRRGDGHGVREGLQDLLVESAGAVRGC